MKSQKAVVFAATLLVFGVVVQGCYRTEAPPDPRTAQQKQDGEWFNKKAKEVGGDFNKLSPEDKQRAIQISGTEGNARTGMGFAAQAKSE